MLEEDEQKRRIYNSKDLTKKRRPGERKEAPGGLGGVGASPSLGKWSLLLRTLGRPIRCTFHPQNKPSPHQSPTFGPTLYKFIVMGSVRIFTTLFNSHVFLQYLNNDIRNL